MVEPGIIGSAAVVEEQRVASPVVRAAERVDIGLSVVNGVELDDRSRRGNKSLSEWHLFTAVFRSGNQGNERRLALIFDGIPAWSPQAKYQTVRLRNLTSWRSRSSSGRAIADIQDETRTYPSVRKNIEWFTGHSLLPPEPPSERAREDARR